MDAAKAQVLLDVALLTLGALAVGLPLFALLRHRDPEIGWGHHGNVWTPFDRLDLAAAGMVFLYFSANALAPALMSESLNAAGDAEGAANPMADIPPLVLIGVHAVFTLAIGAGVFAFASVLRRRDPKQLFGLDRLGVPALLLWTVGGLIVGYIAVAIGAVIWTVGFEKLWGGEQDLQEVVEMMMKSTDPLLRGLLLLTAIVIAPLVEEVVFRGFLYPVFKRYTDRFFAMVVTSLLFALVHANVPGLLPLFFLAIVLTAAYELSGCLWVPIAIHAAFNASQSAFMILYPNAQ